MILNPKPLNLLHLLHLSHFVILNPKPLNLLHLLHLSRFVILNPKPLNLLHLLHLSQEPGRRAGRERNGKGEGEGDGDGEGGQAGGADEGKATGDGQASKGDSCPQLVFVYTVLTNPSLLLLLLLLLALHMSEVSPSLPFPRPCDSGCPMRTSVRRLLPESTPLFGSTWQRRGSVRHAGHQSCRCSTAVAEATG